jgi:hypothetical protein
MIDHLSPRECAELEDAERRGLAWPRVIRGSFLRGTRLLLGIDRARTEEDIARAGAIDAGAMRVAIEEAARWCGLRGLHLLGFPVEDAPHGERRHFMAVG